MDINKTKYLCFSRKEIDLQLGEEIEICWNYTEKLLEFGEMRNYKE